MTEQTNTELSNASLIDAIIADFDAVANVEGETSENTDDDFESEAAESEQPEKQEALSDDEQEEANKPQSEERPAPKSKRARAEYEEKMQLKAELKELKQWKQQQEMRGQIEEENRNKTLELLKNEKATPEEKLNQQLEYYGVPTEDYELATDTEKKAMLMAAQTKHEVFVSRVENQASQLVSIIQDASEHDSREAQVFAQGAQAYIGLKCNELVQTGQAENINQAGKIVVKNLAMWANNQVASGKAKDVVHAVAALVMPLGVNTPAKSKQPANQNASPKNLERAKAMAGTHGLNIEATKSQGNINEGLGADFQKELDAIYGNSR